VTFFEICIDSVHKFMFRPIPSLGGCLYHGLARMWGINPKEVFGVEVADKETGHVFPFRGLIARRDGAEYSAHHDERQTAVCKISKQWIFIAFEIKLRVACLWDENPRLGWSSAANRLLKFKTRNARIERIADVARQPDALKINDANWAWFGRVLRAGCESRRCAMAWLWPQFPENPR
jgi:hypothetical protein